MQAALIKTKQSCTARKIIITLIKFELSPKNINTVNLIFLFLSVWCTYLQKTVSSVAKFIVPD
jgi:hypothetical protein